MLFELWTSFVLSWFILFPAYAANSMPVLARGRRPLDFGKIWGGKRILGDGKTIEGTAVGTIAGFAVGLAEYYLMPSLQFYAGNITIPEITPIVAIMIAIGTMVGDIVGSFIKRRKNMPRGGQAPILDRLGFIIAAIIFAYPFVKITLGMIVIMLIITFIIHKASNSFAHKMKLKSVPW